MSIHISSLVWGYSLPDSIPNRQTSNVKLVLLKLADNSSDEGKSWPSIERIAHECAMSYRTVTRSLEMLESAGVIKRVSRSDRGMKTSNIYWVNINLLVSNQVKYENKCNLAEENPFQDGSSRPLDRSSSQNNGASRPINHQEPSIKDNHQSNCKRFSAPQKERRYSHNELNGFDYKYSVHASMLLADMKSRLPNLYAGSLTEEQWDNCEANLSAVCEDASDVATLLETIYIERNLANHQSVSLPYMVFAHMEPEEFSHMAINCEAWI